jgi:hypothetical protein
MARHAATAGEAFKIREMRSASRPFGFMTGSEHTPSNAGLRLFDVDRKFERKSGRATAQAAVIEANS